MRIALQVRSAVLGFDRRCDEAQRLVYSEAVCGQILSLKPDLHFRNSDYSFSPFSMYTYDRIKPLKPEGDLLIDYDAH